MSPSRLITVSLNKCRVDLLIHSRVERCLLFSKLEPFCNLKDVGVYRDTFGFIKTEETYAVSYFGAHTHQLGQLRATSGQRSAS